MNLTKYTNTRVVHHRIQGKLVKQIITEKYKYKSDVYCRLSLPRPRFTELERTLSSCTSAADEVDAVATVRSDGLLPPQLLPVGLPFLPVTTASAGGRGTGSGVCSSTSSGRGHSTSLLWSGTNCRMCCTSTADVSCQDQVA